MYFTDHTFDGPCERCRESIAPGEATTTSRRVGWHNHCYAESLGDHTERPVLTPAQLARIDAQRALYRSPPTRAEMLEKMIEFFETNS